MHCFEFESKEAPVRRVLKRLPIVLAGLVLATSAWAQSFDLVIKNGRVMDPETLYDGVANVGIKDGRIAAISKKDLSGAKTIDATGQVVAPGFIDTHFHWH